MVLNRIFPSLGISAADFAVAAMGGVVGGATGAALAAIVMIYEMTMDYRVIIPLTITVALSYGMRRILVRDSIYTRKLTRRGHQMPEALQTNFHFVRRASGIMDAHFAVAKGSQTIGQFAGTLSGEAPPALVVTDAGESIVGVVIGGQCGEISRLSASACLESLSRTDYVMVSPEAPLLDILSAMRAKQASVALVASTSDFRHASKVEGVITEHRLLESLEEGLDMYG
jgi:CIC family chloride channel protein